MQTTIVTNVPLNQPVTTCHHNHYGMINVAIYCISSYACNYVCNLLCTVYAVNKCMSITTCVCMLPSS